jgi:SAM-dependent methyltransferase
MTTRINQVNAKILKNLTSCFATYYKNSFATAEAAKQVGWRDVVAQKQRFAALAQLLPNGAPFSINDLGCGHGDLLLFLCNLGCEAVDYAGYDVMEEMIQRAKAKHGNLDREFALIKAASEMRIADFTVASGIFNLRADLSDEEWLAYIHDTLAQMDAKSSKGFAFNCLTKYSDAKYMRPELYYADPLLIFDHCKRKFSKNVALLHDYGEFDFTVIVRK